MSERTTWKNDGPVPPFPACGPSLRPAPAAGVAGLAERILLARLPGPAQADQTLYSLVRTSIAAANLLRDLSEEGRANDERARLALLVDVLQQAKDLIEKHAAARTMPAQLASYSKLADTIEAALAIAKGTDHADPS